MVPGDDSQDIVEVVRDAAGQLADGFHLLGLAELRLRRLLFPSSHDRRRKCRRTGSDHVPHPGQRDGPAHPCGT